MSQLTIREQRYLAWYRQLKTVQKLAIRCYLFTGDIRLILHLWKTLALPAERHTYWTLYS